VKIAIQFNIVTLAKLQQSWLTFNSALDKEEYYTLCSATPVLIMRGIKWEYIIEKKTQV